MKRIPVIPSILLALIASACAFGASIPGVAVTGSIVPTDTVDTYATHQALYGKGGLRTMATLSDRNSIPAARREAGMMVRVTADNSIWRLNSDLTTWREDSEIIEHVVGTGPGYVVGTSGGSVSATNTYRSYVRIETDCRWVRLWWSGWKQNGSGIETNITASYTIKASIELANSTNGPSGAIIPVTFRGSRTGTIDPKGILGSDEIPIALTAGSVMFIRVLPLGTDVPYNDYSRQLTSEMSEGTGSGDVVDGGAIAAPSVSQLQRAGMPVAVTGGVRSQDAEGWVVYGDSIALGNSDNASLTSKNPASLHGWVARGLAAQGRPYIRLSIASERAQHASSSQASIAARAWANRYARYASIMYGSNDFSASIATNSILSSLDTLAATLKTGGIRKVAVSTILPRNSSTDGFVTTNNQTVAATESIRAGLNALLLAGALTNVDAVWNPLTNMCVGTNFELFRTNIGPVVSGSITNSPTSTVNILYTGTSVAGMANGVFDAYILRFTSGTNSGLARTVFQSWTGGLVGTSVPFPAAPASGDTFELIPSVIDHGGVHPTATGYNLMSTAVNVSAFVD
jgi:hypothetical protein